MTDRQDGPGRARRGAWVRRGLGAGFAALVLAVAAGCTTGTGPTPEPQRTETAATPQERPTTTEAAPDQVGAYVAIVRWLVNTDEGLNGHTFAIDTSGTGLKEPQRLVDALRADPAYAKHEIIAATRTELELSGQINAKELYFEDGFLIEFREASLGPQTVTVAGEKWASGLGAIFATLTARWQDDRWVVEEPDSIAIA